MLITCRHCTTSYQVETSSLGAAGRAVRCTRCRNVWFARDAAALAGIAEAHRAEVEAFATSVSIAEWVALPLETAAPLRRPAEADRPTAPVLRDAQTSAAPVTEAPSPDAAAASPAEAPRPDPHELVTITDAPVLAQDKALPEPAPVAVIEARAVSRPQRPSQHVRQPQRAALPIAILALAAFNAGLIGWRVDMVRLAPQTASLYAAIGLPVNLRGLAFAQVSATAEARDGVRELVVEGTIASASARIVEVPGLRFTVRNSGGQEVYAWTEQPARSSLAPGETLSFRSRLASPPSDAGDVLVRFTNQRDQVAGLTTQSTANQSRLPIP